MAYAAEHDLYVDQANVLHKIVIRSIWIAAKDVLNEDPGTANHDERLAWANSIRNHPDKAIGEGHRAMVRVLENATVAAAGNAATDNDVQFVVNGLVDWMAGV